MKEIIASFIIASIAYCAGVLVGSCLATKRSIELSNEQIFKGMNILMEEK